MAPFEHTIPLFIINGTWAKQHTRNDTVVIHTFVSQFSLTSFQVLFTGVVDEDGEKVVVRLGGGLAKGVGDMTHLVTDKVRRTVKFLCAVARGVPIVTPDWLSKVRNFNFKVKVCA